MQTHPTEALAEFKSRRQQLIAQMVEGVAIIPTAAEAIRNRDSHYPYRFDSYFYYLTGFKEPEALLVLVAGNENKSILFCRDKDMEREIWDGFRYGAEAAKAEFGFDEAYSFNQLDEMLPKLLGNQTKLFYSLGADASWDARVTGWLNQVKSQARTGISAPDEVFDVRKLVDEMRLYKSAYEIDVMRRSANIAAAAHNRAMQKTRAGK
ncbi:MAG TPA: aminopeptidase P N-terminal domain-containing protein, partial [Methylotenera sp.]|nr:aminopeptidase P N-terminal domain-containing protein [Methylotenera sp.]